MGRQVHLLLLQFGIVGGLRFKPNDSSGAWVISVTGDNARLFYKRVGFRLSRKQNREKNLPEKRNRNLDVIPHLPPISLTSLGTDGTSAARPGTSAQRTNFGRGGG